MPLLVTRVPVFFAALSNSRAGPRDLISILERAGSAVRKTTTVHMPQRRGKIGSIMSDTMINPATEAESDAPRDISNVLPGEEARRIKAQAEYDQAVTDYRNAIQVASQRRWTASPGVLTRT